MSIQEKEKQVNMLIEQGKIDTAVEHIYDLVVLWAKEKDFKKANAWREKLIEINPMAFNEILNSGEVIESEKTNIIDYSHKTIWENLYHALTLDEGNSFYMKLKQRDISPGKEIIVQGQLNNTLFFVDHGQLKTIFSQGGKEIFLNDLRHGDTAGQDTFFRISNCSSSVIAVSPVKIRYLDRSALQEMEDEFPGFTEKLESFCSRLEGKNTQNILKDKAIERRQHKRHKLAGKITAQIVNKDGNPDGPAFFGWLDDISVGGASFFIQCSNKDVGRALLGRVATLSVQFEKGPQIKFYGPILGARFDLLSAYTIHLRFHNPFDESKLEEIVAICPPSTPTPPAIS